MDVVLSFYAEQLQRCELCEALGQEGQLVLLEPQAVQHRQ
jgi:hypothetical protein